MIMREGKTVRGDGKWKKSYEGENKDRVKGGKGQSGGKELRNRDR